jgi:hypothetical protein
MEKNRWTLRKWVFSKERLHIRITNENLKRKYSFGESLIPKATRLLEIEYPEIVIVMSRIECDHQ